MIHTKDFNLQSGDFKDYSRKLLPIIKVSTQTGSTETKIMFSKDNQLLHQKIVGDISCFYGIETETSFQLLFEKNVPDLLNIEDVNKIAQENLFRAIQNKLQVHKFGNSSIGLTCGGNHEAALILLSGIWNLLSQKLGASIVFALIAKDLAVFSNSENVEDINAIKEMISEVHSTGERLLSKKLFLHEDGKFEVFST
ncbi:MAG: hypothetical protein RLN81_13135 [Balneolaceae bacterium]